MPLMCFCSLSSSSACLLEFVRLRFYFSGDIWSSSTSPRIYALESSLTVYMYLYFFYYFTLSHSVHTTSIASMSVWAKSRSDLHQNQLTCLWWSHSMDIIGPPKCHHTIYMNVFGVGQICGTTVFATRTTIQAHIGWLSRTLTPSHLVIFMILGRNEKSWLLQTFWMTELLAFMQKAEMREHITGSAPLPADFSCEWPQSEWIFTNGWIVSWRSRLLWV